MRGFRRSFAAVEDPFQATVADTPVMTHQFMSYFDALVEISQWDNIITRRKSWHIAMRCTRSTVRRGRRIGRAICCKGPSLYDTDNEGEEAAVEGEEVASGAGSD